MVSGMQVQQQLVDVVHDAGRVVPLGGVGAQGVADLPHGRGGGRAVPGDVTDDDADRVVAEVDDVIPVAADVGAVGPRQVAGGVAQAGQVRQGGGQQRPLQRRRERGAGLEKQRPLQRLGADPGEGHERGLFVVVEVAWVAVADDERAEDLTGHGQRQERPRLPFTGRDRGRRVGLRLVKLRERGQVHRVPGAGHRRRRIRMVQRQLPQAADHVGLISVVVAQLQLPFVQQQQGQALTAGGRPQHRADRRIHLGGGARRDQSGRRGLQRRRAGRRLRGAGGGLFRLRGDFGEVPLLPDLIGDLAERHGHGGGAGAGAGHLDLPHLADLRVCLLLAPRLAGGGDRPVPVEQAVAPAAGGDLAEPATDDILGGAPGELGAELVDVVADEVDDRAGLIGHRAQQREAVEGGVERVIQPGAAVGVRRDRHLPQVDEPDPEPVTIWADPHLEVPGQGRPVVVHRAGDGLPGLHDGAVQRQRPVVHGLRPQLPVAVAEQILP